MAVTDKTEEMLRPSPFWEQLSVDERRSLIVAVTAAISNGSATSLTEIAQASGVRTRTIRRHFRGRRRLYSDVVEIVIDRARRLARSQGSTPYSTDAAIELLVWRRIAAYEMVAPVLRAVLERGAGSESFASLGRALRSETEYQLERIRLTGGPADEDLSVAVDAMLSIRRIDQLRRDERRPVGEASAVLNSEIRQLFASRGAHYSGVDCETSGPDTDTFTVEEPDDVGPCVHLSRGQHLVLVPACD